MRRPPFFTLPTNPPQDSVGNYYDCRLSLQPAVDPVITPAGVLYSREAILKSLLDQKKTAKRRVSEWEAATAAAAAAEAATADVQAAAAVAAFDRATNAGASAASAAALRADIVAAAADGGGVRSAVSIASNRERAAPLKAAWGPAAPQTVAPSVGAKPSTDTRCPATGARLKLKDLTPVIFERPSDGEAAGGNVYAVDPITCAPLTNASRVVVLLPTGHAMLASTYDTCVKPDGAYAGSLVDRVVPLQRGGTGFAAHDGESASASRVLPLGPGTGRADVRGQLATSSRFALQFN